MSFKGDLWEAFTGRGIVVPWWLFPAASRLDDRRRAIQVRRMFLPSIWLIGGGKRSRRCYHRPLKFMLWQRRKPNDR